MRAIALSLLLLLPLSVHAFDYTGDEALRREASLTVGALTAHGFPEPDAVELKEGVLTLAFDGEAARGVLPPAGGTLVETLIGVELAFWGPSVPAPLAGAARSYLSARTRGGEWAPHSLSEALLQAFVLELVKNDPERLGGLWESIGRGEPWSGMERFFAFHFGLSPEAFFARCTARTLPHLVPFLDGIPAAAVREGETEIHLPGAPPLSASALDLRMPSGERLGATLEWDGGRLPAPAFLLVLYGAPLDHFDLVALEPRFDGITLPVSGVARVVLIATSPAFARPEGEPLALRGTLAEDYPCALGDLGLQPGEEGAALSFTARSMRDVAAFVVLREPAGGAARLETVGFLPGLGRAGDPFSFTLVDPERPAGVEATRYHLYAITSDGLMALQGSIALPQAGTGVPLAPQGE
jgi:hypothetical protein